MRLTRYLGNLDILVKIIIAAAFPALLFLVKLIVFLTPENRKNFRSNFRDIKSVAISNKKYLFIVVFIFFAAMALLFSLPGKLTNNEDDAVRSKEVGDIVKFGGSHEKMEWIIIEKNKDYLTLLSRNCLEAKPYQENFNKEEILTWEGSTLKSWLNREFVKNFSESDKSTMVDDHGELVSLLDKEQAEKIEDGNKQWLICTSDSKENKEGEAKEWWLKNPGKNGCAMFVNTFGESQRSCTTYFDNRADRSLFVRPVIRKKM